MKKMTRIAALLAAAVLTLCLTACGGGQAGGGDPLAAARKNIDAASSMDAVMTMNMEMEAGMKVEATTEAAGQEAVISIYAEESGDGSYTLYMNDGTSWHSTAATAEDLEQYEVGQIMSAYIDFASSLKQEGTETMDGVSAYKYTGVITGQNMQDVILESGALNSLSSLGISEDQMKEMLSGLGDIPVTLWITETDLYPVRYDMDMTGVMDGLMKAVLESLGDQAQGLTMRGHEMTITITCSNINSATDFTIPDEAKN